MDAIFILCGGFGTRLKSVIADVPKPMAPIKGKPFLAYQISYIRKYFPNTTIYLLTYYLSDIIEQYFKDDDSIFIIKENKPLGTGGSIKYAIEQLKLKENTNLLILNGDTYIEADLYKLIQNTTQEIIILGSFQKNCFRYGTLEIKNNIIIDFREKDKNSKNRYINAGCYFFRNISFFKKITTINFAIEEQFKGYINNYGIIETSKYDGIFIDIGVPEDYEKMVNYIG